MNVIFLDVDGVLNSMNLYNRVEDILEEPVDLNNVRCLSLVAKERPSTIVLSSSWRGGWNPDPSKCDFSGRVLNEALEKYGLKISDRTPCLDIMDGTGRSHEILKWISDCVEPIDHILIIDDNDFGWKKNGLSDYWVRPDFSRAGFTEEYVEEAKRKYAKPFHSRNILSRIRHWIYT